MKSSKFKLKDLLIWLEPYQQFLDGPCLGLGFVREERNPALGVAEFRWVLALRLFINAPRPGFMKLGGGKPFPCTHYTEGSYYIKLGWVLGFIKRGLSLEDGLGIIFSPALPGCPDSYILSFTHKRPYHFAILLDPENDYTCLPSTLNLDPPYDEFEPDLEEYEAYELELLDGETYSSLSEDEWTLLTTTTESSYYNCFSGFVIPPLPKSELSAWEEAQIAKNIDRLFREVK